jgi:hypothetical protein
MAADRPDVPLHDPKAPLELALLEEYLRTRGVDLHTVHDLPADQATTLLKEAARYAAVRLAEIDARATYVHDIHGARRSE